MVGRDKARRRRRAELELELAQAARSHEAEASVATESAGQPPKRLFLRFVLAFAAWVAVFYAAVFSLDLFEAAIEWTALRTGEILGLLGESATVSGRQVITPRYSYTIALGCDGVEPAIFYSAAVLGFPVPWSLRLLGLAGGWLAILGLNLTRLISLYYIGVHAPDSFETFHVDVWQPAFVVLTLVFWLAWCIWANRRLETA